MAKKRQQSAGVFNLSFSYIGVLGATYFVALSLTPSLLPRGAFFQGIVTGITMMIGYALGMAGQKLWQYLELPTASKKTQVNLNRWVQAITGLFLLYFLFKFVGWQNEVREIFGAESINATILIPVIIVSIIIAAIILISARAIRKLFRFIAVWIRKVLPP